MYKLEAENIVAAGGPMHLQNSCYTMWTKYFKTVAKAKKYAQTWHKKKEYTETLEWTKFGEDTNNTSSSQDCGWVMYHIEKIKVEK